MKLNLALVTGILLALIAIGISIAQESCPMIVAQALQSMGDNCSELDRNSACYGYNLVSAQFSETVDEEFFTEPADTSHLSILESIQTSAMNLTESQWGVAVLNLQANLPNTLPGQGVKFVLLGDVEVENQNNPANAFQPADAITATVTGASNIRSGAGLNFNVIGTAQADDTLPIDAVSGDGEWYRTVIGDRVGWIFGNLLAEDDNLSSLPVIDGTQRSAMQAFYLRTGFGQPACEEAPQDTLMIQGPEGIEVDLTVNGADISIGSTILVRLLPPGDIMEMLVIDGYIKIPGGAPDGGDLLIPEGYRTTACLTPADNRGVDGESNDRLVGCEWSEPEEVPDADLGGAWCTLENVPENLLNYPIELNCGEEEEPQTVIITNNSNPSSPPATEEPEPDDLGKYNFCLEGNIWGDGRCNFDDPDLTNFWWNSGFYLGLVEEGIIDINDVPEPYYIPPEVVEEEEEDDSSSVKLSCSGDGYYEVDVSKAPSGDTSAAVFFFDEGISSTGSSGTFSVPGGTQWFAYGPLTDVEIVFNPSESGKSLKNIYCEFVGE